MAAYIYDLAQLIHQQNLAPVTIVRIRSAATSACATRYPSPTRCASCAIEGLGPVAQVIAERGQKSMMRAHDSDWIDEQRKLSGRLPRRYPTIEDAFKRMQEEKQSICPPRRRVI